MQEIHRVLLCYATLIGTPDYGGNAACGISAILPLTLQTKRPERTEAPLIDALLLPPVLGHAEALPFPMSMPRTLH